MTNIGERRVISQKVGTGRNESIRPKDKGGGK